MYPQAAKKDNRANGSEGEVSADEPGDAETVSNLRGQRRFAGCRGGAGWRKIAKSQALALFCLGFACVVSLLAGAGRTQAETIRIGAQKTGTFAWELAVIKAEKLDEKAGLDLVVTQLATTEAGKIALLGGSVDLILSDWLWVARERGLGSKIAFHPYSSSLGAVMVQASSPAQTLEDLRGKSIGVAGGPIDKSWLLLRALAQRDGLDLKANARVAFGAPALLYEKSLSGELDASLTFWTYAVALEARGFRKLIGMDEVERRLGAKGPIAMVGYVFDESFAAAHGEALRRFFEAAHDARLRLSRSDADWARIGKEIGVTNPRELALYRQRYVEGFPQRSIADEAADAATLYAVVREIGGPDLVGAATSLDPGVFYRAAVPAAPAVR